MHVGNILMGEQRQSRLVAMSKWRSLMMSKSHLYIETFTPTEAAAFVELPTKKIYQEVEYRILPEDNPPRLNFAALVYLRLIKEINFG